MHVSNESRDNNANNNETAIYDATRLRKNMNDKINLSNYQVGIRSTYFHSRMHMLLDFLLPIIIVAVFVTVIPWHFLRSVLQFYEFEIKKLVFKNHTNVIGQEWNSIIFESCKHARACSSNQYE